MKKLLLASLFSLLFFNLSTADELNQKIDQAKKICKELGFKEGSEKLADCALELVSMDNLVGETQTNVVSSNTTTEGQEYTFTGEATFGIPKKTRAQKKHEKRVAKFIKYPDQELCVGYINNSWRDNSIFKKKENQKARSEAIRIRGLDCNQYRDAAYHKKNNGYGVAEVLRDLAVSQGDIARENEKARAKNKNRNLNCTSKQIGSSVSTNCY